MSLCSAVPSKALSCLIPPFASTVVHSQIKVNQYKDLTKLKNHSLLSSCSFGYWHILCIIHFQGTHFCGLVPKFNSLEIFVRLTEVAQREDI